MLNYGRRGDSRRFPTRLWIDLTQAQLERLDRASGGLGPQAFVRLVALRLADHAIELQQERQRSLFAGA